MLQKGETALMIAEKNGHTSIIALLKQFPLVQRAMALGSKPWNRSKVMLVGEGRVGKTALRNSMMGKPSEDTESTVGLTQLTCDVLGVAISCDRRWTEHTKPEREFEAGVAQLVKNMELIELQQKKSLYRINESVRTDLPESEQINEAFPIKNKEPLPADDIHSIRNQKEYNPGSVNDDGETPIRMTRDSTPVQIKPDMMLVMNCLADVKVMENNLILSLLDFGGQSVFNIIHHLFLTSYGIYVVVFNMVDILDDDKREQSLSEMSFWINSIVMHTRDVMSGKIPPVFLVGTHKDDVNDTANFERISQIIEERFRYNIGWPYIQEYRNSIANYSLYFFPVNNKEGLHDDIVADLKSAIEDVVKEADYVIVPRPLTWLKALDEFMATKKSYLPMTEVTSIAIANGVEEDAVHVFLTFLNEMGVVLWLDEEGLRDVVILDIITFFVEPVTLIICNHISKPSDSTVHHRKIQEVCRKNMAMEWDEMTQRGLVNQSLMEFLLSHKVKPTNIPIIINMMLKYGLIVKLDHGQDINSKGHLAPAWPSPVYYLVPALLPRHPTNFEDDVWEIITKFNSCYFFFTTDQFCSSNWYNFTILQKEGFLPWGLMERLIAKAVERSQLTNLANMNDITRLYQNYATISYGRQQFRLVCIPEINCIRLNVEGEHPLPVYNRICEQIDACVKECMGSLQFITALRYVTASEAENQLTLLNLVSVREVDVKDTELIVKDHPSVTLQYVTSHFAPWLINSDIINLSSYDVFISHRWLREDDEVVDQLYDSFLGQVVGSEKRAVKVFYDKVWLKGARQCQKTFGKSLINSTILVPMLTTDSLQKMLSHNPEEEDNVLIEWMLALECMQDPIHSKIRGIYPLMFGGRREDGSRGFLFSEKIISKLPDIIPKASMIAVRSILNENAINIGTQFDCLTVRSVVLELTKYLGSDGWISDTCKIISTAVSDIIIMLEVVDDDSYHSIVNLEPEVPKKFGTDNANGTHLNE